MYTILTSSTPRRGVLHCASLRSGRYSRDNGAPRLVGPPDAPVAPHSLRSLVRPRQCAHRPDMSLGPGDCAAIVYL